MDEEVYGWVVYINGSDDDYIVAWSAYEKDLTVDPSVSHWQWVMPAKQALEQLNYTDPTMGDLIECMFNIPTSDECQLGVGVMCNDYDLCCQGHCKVGKS